MKEYAEAFYGGGCWKRTRKAFIEERIAADGGMCQICRERLGFIVHHLVELTPENINDPLVALNQENLRYVCLQCHNQEHGFFCAPADATEFDDEGNFIPPPRLSNPEGG